MDDSAGESAESEGTDQQISKSNFCELIVLDFDEIAAVEFQRLKKKLPRIGTMDLKIGAIALTKNAIVVTRYTKDFSQITGLQVEDWTIDTEKPS